MSEVFFAALSPMLLLFSCLAIGFALQKAGVLPEHAATTLSRLELYVLCPALNIITFMTYATPASLQGQLPSVLLGALGVLAAIGLSYPLSRLFAKERYQRNIYKYALTFANFGFMGNALVPAVLGGEALYYYMLFTLPPTIGVYSWGLAILIPHEEGKPNLLKNLLNPGIISIVAGLILGLLGASAWLPAFVTSTLSSLSACMGPIAMVLTGVVIGGFRLRDLLTRWRIYLVAILRLFILPAAMVALLWLCGADRTTLLCALFMFATPMGLNTVVFPAAYGGDASTGASMAMISHTLSVVTLPLMYALFCVVFP